MRILPFVLALFLIACGGGGSSGGGAAQTSVAGTWAGSWDETAPNSIGGGLARLTIQSSGGEVSGAGKLTGSPCVNNFSFDGLVSGNSVSLNLIGELAAVSVNLRRIGENTMEGTWHVAASNHCIGEGTITLNRE